MNVSSGQVARQVESAGEAMESISRSLESMTADFERSAARAEEVLDGAGQQSAEQVSELIRQAKSAVGVAVQATVAATQKCRAYVQGNL